LVIVKTTCSQCKELLELSSLRQHTHPDCPPDHLDQLEAAFLAAVLAGDIGTADALAVTLDRADRGCTELLEAATAYARDGWPVFPCIPGDKRPASRHGFRDATTDVDRIVRYWRRVPTANIGVATGHCFDVIDVDYAGKPDALDWWLKVKEADDFEIDGLVTTPRGLHVYVLPTGAGPASKLFDINGVDYRGIGGYVVVPPSVRDDGSYRWMVAPSPRIKST
jgi:hypothetical protein